jgi:hypothetical protein
MALIVLAVVLLALAGILAAAPLLVDRDALLRRVEAEIGAASGLAVRIDGVQALTLLPTPRAVLGPIRLLPPVGGADGALVSADSLRLDLDLTALLFARAEPLALHLTGIDGAWAPPPAATLPLWLAALRPPAVAVQGGELRLDYPPGARPLSWPLFATPSTWRPAADTGPLRASATLPLVAEAQAAGTLQLDAELATATLPVLGIAPLRLTGSGIALGALDALDFELAAAALERDAAGGWRVESLLLDADGLKLSGTADIATQTTTDGATVPQARGRLALAPMDLRAWLGRHWRAPLPGRPGTLGCVAADAELALDGDLLGIAPLRIQLDDGRAAAAATVQLAALPRVAVALHADRLDLDAYLAPPAPPADQPAEPAAPPATTCAAAEPMAFPQAPVPPVPPESDVDLHVELAADALRAGGLGYGAVAGMLTQRGMHTGVDVAAGAFYGGTLRVRGEQMVHVGAAPQQTLRAQAAAVDLGALLTDLQGTAPITGSADLTAELAAAGADLPALRRDLSGTLRAEVRDGRLAAVDRAVQQFGPLLSTVGLPVGTDLADFSRLRLSATGADGVFRSDDIDGRARLLHLTGGGELDAPGETVTADLVATLVQPPDGPDLKGLDGIRVPISIAGSVMAPKVDADVAPAVAEAARRAARRHLESDDNLFRQLEDATGVEGLERGLRGLFGL